MDEVECLVNSEWFGRLFKGNNWHEFMKGFGQIEKEKGAGEDEPLDEAALKKNLALDLLAALDRDLTGTLNFSEYMTLRKSVMAWL